MIYDINGNPIDTSGRKTLSMLIIGNSMAQDGLAYVPYLLKTYYPEVDFHFYLWYIAGYKLSQQYTAFQNQTKADIFSVAENTAAWTNYSNQKTIDNVLSAYTFDIVCMMDYMTGRSTFVESDLAGWTNCQNYIRDNYQGGNAFEFITFFHAPSNNSPVDANFALIKTANALILNKTIAQDMIPCGIAKYRALDTELDSLGDAGHLTVDGGHAQEGLPSLLQAECAVCWILDKLGINKSIYGSAARMTTAIYNTISVPGPNLGTGVITGTDAQNILAQEVAIKAYKEGKQFVINSLHSES